MFLIGIDRLTVTIANGQSVSPAVQLGAKALVGIVIPSTWTAAPLTFQASFDGGANYYNVQDGNGQDTTLLGLASTFVQVDAGLWRGINDLIVRSGPSGAAVAQTGAQILTLIVRSNLT